MFGIEILEVIDYAVHYWMLVVTFSLLSLVLLSAIISFVLDLNPRDPLTIVLFAALLFLSLSGLKSTIEKGVAKEYRAIVTDFNEVYNNGYSIMYKDGTTYILQKER